MKNACEMAIELNSIKMKIYEYVESKMAFIAPNLSIMIGASTAAKMIGEYSVYLICICNKKRV